ncbi:MAG: GYD domain-containing protein [Chloroflexi bacterium]|nr:GYD domain-containing protein [Chloroflexota bacterium]
MQTYILLSNLTDEGRRTLKDRPERLEEVNRELEEMGGRIIQQFALLGAYDFVTVIEAPDNHAVTQIAVALSSRGTIRLQTLAAFPTSAAQPAPRRLLGRAKMETYVVFAKLTPAGRKDLREQPDRLSEIGEAARRLGAAITNQYQVLGEYDYVTFVEAPDNTAAATIATEVIGLGSVRLSVHPTIKLERFMELLRIRSYRTEPHAWQTQPWARAVRYVGRHWVIYRHVHEYCRPLTATGIENVADVRGPALIIANHSSHFDTPVALTALPPHLRAKTAVAAAADRFYRHNKKRTWWFSLFWNTFPITRGGGKAALAYPMSLLERGWSILIYPEGGRFKPGQVQRFHHGATIMAMQAKVPVIPIYLAGLSEIMPKGTRTPRPGPVSARLGPPVSLDGVESVPAGTALLEQAMRELAAAPAHD